jgi:hypothetical protein
MTVIYVAKNGQTLAAGQPQISFVDLQLATWHLELSFPAYSGSFGIQRKVGHCNVQLPFRRLALLV